MYSAFFFKFLAAIDKKVKIIVTVMLVPDTLFELITIILTVYFAEQYRRIWYNNINLANQPIYPVSLFLKDSLLICQSLIIFVPDKLLCIFGNILRYNISLFQFRRNFPSTGGFTCAWTCKEV